MKRFKLPILMYHKLADNDYSYRKVYTVKVGNFKAQMKYLSEAGFKTVSLSRLTTDNNKVSELEQRTVGITFDDGLESDYTFAYPILKEYGFSAVFFVTVNYLGTPGYLSWQQLKDLRSNGMCVGSHTMNHKILTRLSRKEIRYEIIQSKEVLENKLAAKIDMLSIPRGFLNSYIIRTAHEAGYKVVFTSHEWFNDLRNIKPVINRIVIRSDYSLNEFKKVVNCNFAFLASKKIEKIPKFILRKILGLNIYEELKKSLISRKTKNV